MPVMSAETLVGCRIVLRYLRPAPGDGPRYSDLVGELIALTDTEATVQTRRGPVTVARDAIGVLRPVAASRREVLALERISRRGWRAAEVVELDGWLLFADRGWTGRANSVLPLRTPSQPLPAMLRAAGKFYAERGLPLQIQLPLPARDLLDAELASRGWQVGRRTVVLTAPVPAAELPDPELPPDYQLRCADRPDDRWLAGYHYRGGSLPEHAVQLLSRHARGAVDDGWLGVTAVEVDPDHRHRGLATSLMAGLQAWASGLDARRCYLQVDEANDAALALYRRLGFTEHHRYHYRIEP
jgi:ribosomal protein S18 acetylase RimI-like enzyme